MKDLSLLGLGLGIGGMLMYFAAKMRFRVLERRFAETRRASGMLAYEHGLAMGLSFARVQQPRAVLDGPVEHWEVADEQTLISNLTSFTTYEGES